MRVLQVYNVDPPPAAAGRGRRRREQAGSDTAARIRSQSSENMIRQEFNPFLSVPIRHNLSHSVIILSYPSQFITIHCLSLPYSLVKAYPNKTKGESGNVNPRIQLIKWATIIHIFSGLGIRKGSVITELADPDLYGSGSWIVWIRILNRMDLDPDPGANFAKTMYWILKYDLFHIFFSGEAQSWHPDPKLFENAGSKSDHAFYLYCRVSKHTYPHLLGFTYFVAIL